MTRDHAHQVLDAAKAGRWVSDADISDALRATGDVGSWHRIDVRAVEAEAPASVVAPVEALVVAPVGAITTTGMWQTKPLRSFIAKPERKKAAGGWGKNDPMHMTPQTKVTICPPPTYSYHTNTHEL